jgi:hypothetical protein
MAQPNVITRSLIPAVATAIATSQSPAAGAITLTAPIVTLDTQRRVVITSGGNDTGINFTVFGTNQVGAPIQDTFAGGNGTASVGLSNLDFLTINAITHSGSVASTLTAGTGNTGSSLWQIINWNPTPINMAWVIEQRTGTSVFAIEITLDDPNILPGTGGLNAAGLAFPLATSISTAIGLSNFTSPFVAWRLTINSGTGTLVTRALQAGLASP